MTNSRIVVQVAWILAAGPQTNPHASPSVWTLQTRLSHDTLAQQLSEHWAESHHVVRTPYFSYETSGTSFDLSGPQSPND